MRVTVSHTRSKEEVIRAVDRSFDDLFKGIGMVPLQIIDERRTWSKNILTFSFVAKAGLLSTPIRGTVEVTDNDVTVDADLGLLEKLLPIKQAKTALETRVKGLLR